MTVYNDEKFLAIALESLLRQNYNGYELIIVDDCSTDKTPSILNHYKSKFINCTIIRNLVNLGLGASLVLGFKNCNGEYVLRMDSDDICFDNRMIDTSKFILSNPNIDIIGSNALLINAAGIKIGLRTVPIYHNDITKKIWACPMIHPSVCFKKISIEKIGGYDSSISRCCDYDLWFKCYENGLKFHNIAEPLIYYRHDINTHKKNSIKYLIEQTKVGLYWCWRLRLSFWKYFAVMFPLLRGIMPIRVRALVYKYLRAY